MIVRLALAAALVVLPALAWAHGEHGSAKPLASAVGVGGYEVELLSDPAPLAAGRESRIVAKVLKNSPLAPVTGGMVRVSLIRPGGTHEPQAAAEVAWAGNYSAPFTPRRQGAHQVRVILEELEGRRLTPPIVVDFPVTVEAAPGMSTGSWWLLALVAGTAAVALYLVGARARSPARSEEGFNLLELSWLRGLLTARWFQPALQVPLLGLMAVVVFLGFHDVQDGGVNLATKLTWTIWWAAIIFTFALAGRVWCLACPFGALNEWASRLAAPLRRLPKAFRNIWWATAMFVLLTWADEQLGVVRSPVTTAWIVLFFAALALAIGVFYERRSFCRYLCPIGGLIGIYSMTAPVELRAKDRATCLAHHDKTCYRGAEGARGCPMFEFPQSMDRNTYCTLCAECVKGCGRDNLAVRFRAFGKDLWASGRRVLDEAYLAVALAGLTVLVTAQMLSAWPGWISALAGWLPTWVRSSLKPVTYLGLVESVILLGGTLVVAPLLALAAAAATDRLAGGHGLGLRRTFVTFGYVLVPVGLAMHLAHNLAHLLLEGGGIVPVVQRAVMLYTPLSVGEPDWETLPLASEPVVTLLQALILVGFFALSLLAAHRLSLRVYPDARTASRALVPVAVLSFVFTVVGLVLLQQPMGMRHGM